MERPSGILRYESDEMLRLQEAYGEFQEEWWAQLLTGLGPEVAEELHGLQAVPDASRFRRRSKNSERRLRSKAKREALHALPMNALVSDRDGQEADESCPEDSSESSWQRVTENTGGRSHAGRGSWNNPMFCNEDKPEVESFQPPAFAVEGDPDFESGPPQDGWEYLRRVKYEAARCPKVVVAAIDPAKLTSEQTPYMPEMPEIQVSPPDLLPSKEWEQHFLGDFALLRMALSNMHVPPTSASERIPSLRNKAAWEVRCFGAITSVQHEDSKEPDRVTGGPTGEFGGGEGAPEAEIFSPISLDSAQNVSDFVASERLELIDDEKAPPAPFMELIEAQLDQLYKRESVEASYVIDLGSLNTQVPILGDGKGSFNESEYLISGEPVDVHGNAAYSGVGIPEPEDNPVTSTEVQDSHDFNIEELVHAEGLSTSGEQHGDNEDMQPSCSYLSRVSIDSDRLTISDSMGSIGTGTRATLAHMKLESSTDVVIQAEHLPTKRVEDVFDGIICMEPSSAYFEEVERETDQLPGADFMNSLGYAEPRDHMAFGDLCTGIETQFEYLSIGELEGVQSEVQAMLPSLSYTESLEFENVLLPTTDFTDSLVGLEVYRSGSVLQAEPDKSVDASGHIIEFKIDESLEELFTKVFHVVGISQLPFIHLLLRLDEVSRAALFRYHVSWLENVDGLPQDRALWLLALSVVVDNPLDAQTSAAFRAMLRHCAGIRALKQSRDDEDLYMLNVLITVAGLYFGQAEAVTS